MNKTTLNFFISADFTSPLAIRQLSKRTKPLPTISKIYAKISKY